MLFEKYHELNYSQLAEALEYLSKEMKFEKNRSYGVNEKIKIDKNITIVIKYCFNLSGIDSMSLKFDYNEFRTETYINDILVNDYKFKFDKYDCLKWKLIHKNIYHKLSNDIIDFINDWCFKVLAPKRAKEKIEIEIEKQRKISEKMQEKKREDQIEDKLKSIYKQYRKRGRKLCQ